MPNIITVWLQSPEKLDGMVPARREGREALIIIQLLEVELNLRLNHRLQEAEEGQTLQDYSARVEELLQRGSVFSTHGLGIPLFITMRLP